MSLPVPASFKPTKSKKEFNRFLFRIVNEFSLHEFIEYTNFTAIMTGALIEKKGSTDRLDHYIKKNFKKTVPNETKWKQGGFVSLKLTKDFYDSEVADRIFRKIFGIKKFTVRLSNVLSQSNAADKIDLTSESEPLEVQELSSDDDGDGEADIEQVDLTKDEHLISTSECCPPKRRIKYPRKQSHKDVALPSGIATYASTSRFVDQIPTSTLADELNEKICISSTEPAIETPNSSKCSGTSIITIVNQPNPISPIVVLSNVILVQPRNMEIDQIQPDPKDVAIESSHNSPLNIPKIGSKSKIQESQGSIIQPQSMEVPQETTQNVGNPKPKPKIGPKSRMKISINSSQLPIFNQQDPAQGLQQNVEPKIGSTSIVALSKSTQELLQDLMHTDPSIISPIKQTHQKKPTEKTTKNVGHQKPKVGPKSRMIPIVCHEQPKSKIERKSIANPSTNSSVNPTMLPPEQLLEELMHTEPSIISPINQPLSHQKEQETSRNVGHQTPKSQYSTFKPPLMSTQDLLQHLPHTTPPQLSIINQQELAQRLQQNVEPKTKIGSTSLVTPTSTQDLLQDLMHTDPSIVPSLAHPNEPSRNEDVSSPKRIAGPKSRTSHRGSRQSHTVLAPESSKHGSTSQSLPSTSANEVARSVVSSENTHTSPPKASLPSIKSHVRIDVAGNSITEVRCEGCHAHISLNKQLHIGPQCEVRELFVESPMDTSESTELRKNFKRSFDAQSQHINELLIKYMAETEPKALSLKTFWYDFIKSEYENDNSAAETQLHNSNENVDDVRMGNQSQAILNANQLAVEPYDFTNVQVKMEKIFDQRNDSCSSDVEIIEQAPIEPIEILMDSTQDLVDKMLLDDSEEQLIRPFALPQPPIESCSNVKSTVASSSKGFLTALPNITIKRRVYSPLEIVVEKAQKIPPAILPNHDFSQQPQTPTSSENYEIEECTMTDTQLQRYELLNNENTIFLSSQLENYAFNAGKPIDPKAAQNENTRPIAPKRPLTDTSDCLPYKRRRCTETVKRDLNWKIMSIKTVIFKPLPNNVFHLELQLRNNFDTFYVQDQLSIKRMLHLSDREWMHVARILTALRGFRYDCSERPMAVQKSDLMSRIMNCFVRSIPLFVSSNIQFNDFMGHCLDVQEQQPLVNKNTESAIDPIILQKMRELKKNLCKKDD